MVNWSGRNAKPGIVRSLSSVDSFAYDTMRGRPARQMQLCGVQRPYRLPKAPYDSGFEYLSSCSLLRLDYAKRKLDLWRYCNLFDMEVNNKPLPECRRIW